MTLSVIERRQSGFASSLCCLSLSPLFYFTVLRAIIMTVQLTASIAVHVRSDKVQIRDGAMTAPAATETQYAVQ